MRTLPKTDTVTVMSICTVHGESPCGCGAPFAPAGTFNVSARTEEFLAALNAKSEYGTFEVDPPKPGTSNRYRYVRVLHVTHGSRSAYAFIDLRNGDILKPASFKGPAKHARGNIFTADLGLSCCGRYSVAYLR